MQAYRIDGVVRQGKTNQDFCIDLVAENEDQVREKVYSGEGTSEESQSTKTFRLISTLCALYEKINIINHLNILHP